MCLDPWVVVIVAFPDHTHLLFEKDKYGIHESDLTLIRYFLAECKILAVKSILQNSDPYVINKHELLILEAPITTAADDKFHDTFFDLG